MVSSSPVSPQDGFIHGQLINLVRRGEATSRPALEQKTGLGRKVVAPRIRHAIDVGLIDDSTVAMSAEPGRPSRFLRFRADAGVVYAGMIESTQLWAAVATLDGQLVASLHQIWNSDFGPEETLAALKGMFDRLERKSGSSPWAIGIGISGAVEFERGKVLQLARVIGHRRPGAAENENVSHCVSRSTSPRLITKTRRCKDHKGKLNILCDLPDLRELSGRCRWPFQALTTWRFPRPFPRRR